MPVALLLAVRLCKEGFGVTPQHILRQPTDHVLAMLEYSNLLSTVQETAAEINKPTNA